MCFAQGPQRSGTGEAWTRGLSVSSQALYHWATTLPIDYFIILEPEETGLSLVLSEQSKTSFVEWRPI